MDFEFSDEQQLLRDTLRRFVDERVAPAAAQWDREARFPSTVVNELAEMGIMGVMVAPELGGGGLGAVEMAVCTEEIARGDGSLALTVASHNGLCSSHIRLFGDEQQRAEFLPRLARGEALGAWGLTEPGSGSDASAMQTTAVRDEQSNEWVLNGSKVFITQGSVAGIYVILAATDKAQGTRGVSAFIVEGGAPGLRASPQHHKLGMRSSDTAELSLDNVRVPAERLLGEHNHGFIDTLQVLDRGRITIGSLALGLGEAALTAARTYALERRQFGRPLADFQATQWKLADMSTELMAARLMVYRSAWLCDRGKPFSTEAAMGKLLASEVAMRATEEAVQIHGGYGYTGEFPVERYFRDAKLTTIGEGTSEIQRMVISRALLRDLRQ